MKLLLQWKDIEAEAVGEPAMQPKNRAMTAADFEKQLKKTGNTPFTFENLKVFADGEVFVPNGAINELRRSALQRLEEKAVGAYWRTAEPKPEREKALAGDHEKKEISFHVSVETKEQLEEALASETADVIYVDSSLCSMTELALWYQKQKYRMENRRIYYILPPVFRMETEKRYTEAYEMLKSIPWEGFVVKNAESYAWLLRMGADKPVILDANLYTFNGRAAEFWKNQPLVSMETLPYELNERELKQRGCENAVLPVYGRQPMMVSAGCVYKSLNRCRKAEKKALEPEAYYRLKDRKNAQFPVRPVCTECYNVIYNSLPLSLLNQKERMEALGVSDFRISFTVESAPEVRRILDAFGKNYIENVPVAETFEFTRGHFKRGVE